MCLLSLSTLDHIPSLSVCSCSEVKVGLASLNAEYPAHTVRGLWMQARGAPLRMGLTGWTEHQADLEWRRVSGAGRPSQQSSQIGPPTPLGRVEVIPSRERNSNQSPPSEVTDCLGVHFSSIFAPWKRHVAPLEPSHKKTISAFC